MRYNKQGTCMSVDGAIPADRKVVKEEDEITVEIQRI